MLKNFFIISVLGRAGAGKGTQVKLLEAQTGFEVIRTGDLLREKAKEKSVIGERIQHTLDRGFVMPTPIVFLLWMPILERLYRESNAQGVIFDGNPRRLHEAQMLNELFDLFGWKDRLKVFYIHVEEETAKKRLLERAREDDTENQIAERLAYFKTEVQPVLDYYKKTEVLEEINGEQSIEDVNREVMEKTKSFFEG